MQRPWVSPGIGWIFAVIVIILWALILLHAVAGSAEIIAVSFILLALALLL